MSHHIHSLLAIVPWVELYANLMFGIVCTFWVIDAIKGIKH